MEKVKISKKQSEVIRSVLAKKVKGYTWALENKKGNLPVLKSRKERLESVIAKLPQKAKKVSILKKECEIVAKVIEAKLKGYVWALGSEDVKPEVKKTIQERNDILVGIKNAISPVVVETKKN